MKQNGVSDDALHLSLFLYSFTHHDIAWYDRLPRNSIHSFDDMMRKFLSKYFPPSMVTKLRNDITKFEQKPHELLFEAWEHYKLSIDRCPNHNMLLVTQIDTFYNGLTLSHRDTINAASGATFMQKTPKECYELIENMTAHDNHWDTSVIQDETSRNISSASTTETAGGYTQETVYATTGNYNSGGNSYQLQGPLPSNTITNPRGDLKAITTQSGVSYDGPPIPHPISSLPKVVERVPEVTKDTVQPSTKNIQPPVVQTQVQIDEPVFPLKPKLTIPYPSRANKQKLREKDDNLALKFVEIFRNLHFNLSFADALLHMPKFTLMFKSLLNNKEKLFDLATTPVNENCSAVILKKLPEKLKDPTSFSLHVTFQNGQSSKYAYNDAKSVNQIDVIDVACEEYVQEVLGFSEIFKSGSPTPTLDPIISSSSLYSLLSKEGDILYLEKLLNEDPSSNLHPVKTKDLKQVDATMTKPSIKEPQELEHKELPSYLEYAFLEGNDKLPIIISKELKDKEKSALLKVLKSHKRAIAWKIFDIKGFSNIALSVFSRKSSEKFVGFEDENLS
nr:reverse transcriptase domain-containing protein [Tanacetum cinerariifolium]